MKLVNKDQLQIVADLRSSISKESEAISAENSTLKKQISSLNESALQQTLQINKLLLDKIDLQTDGIGQRERMLERERDLS